MIRLALLFVLLVSAAATGCGSDAGIDGGGGGGDKALVLSNEDGTQNDVRLAPDGEGGVYAVWTDYRASWPEFYGQHIDSSGKTQWQEGGRALVVGEGMRELAAVGNDDAGGLLLAWTSDGPGVLAQRFDASGEAVFGDDGARVADGAARVTGVAPDGKGGAFVVWTEDPEENARVRLQHLGADGKTSLSEALALDESATPSRGAVLVADQAGGVHVAWQRENAGEDTLVAVQRIDGDGGALWTAPLELAQPDQGATPLYLFRGQDDGVLVVYASLGEFGQSGYFVEAVSAGGEAEWSSATTVVEAERYVERLDAQQMEDGSLAFAWSQHRGGQDMDVVAQRVGVDGAARWNAGGVVALDSDDGQLSPALAVSLDGRMAIAWEVYDDERGDYDIHARFLDSSGEALDGAAGTVVTRANFSQVWADAFALEAGVLVAFTDHENAFGEGGISTVQEEDVSAEFLSWP